MCKKELLTTITASQNPGIRMWWGGATRGVGGWPIQQTFEHSNDLNFGKTIFFILIVGWGGELSHSSIFTYYTNTKSIRVPFDQFLEDTN